MVEPEGENSQSLRNSTGKLKAKVKGVDDGPNYLRASTGSCHDICKYGTPHEFKATPQRPVRRRSMPKSEIPVEIFVPSDRKSKRAVKSSSVPDASISTKPEVVVSGKSPSSGAPKSVRQQAPSPMKVRSSHLTGKIHKETQLGVKSLSPDFSNLAKQESPSDVKSLLSPDLSNLVKHESSLDVNTSSSDSKLVKQDSSFDVKSSSPNSSNLVQQESSLDVTSLPPDSSISVKQESLSGVKSLSADSSNLAKQESLLEMKSLQPGSPSSIKKGSSSDAKSPSIAPYRKGSSSQRHSSDASKSTIHDVQSRRKSSSADVTGPTRRSFSKPTKAPHMTAGSTSKTSVTGAKSSSPAATKSVKREVTSSDGKSPLKNASAKLGGSLKSSKSACVSTEQSSSSKLPGRTGGNGLDRRRNSGNDPRTSKEAASKKPMGSPMGSSSLKTRENTKVAVKNILNATKEVAQNEGSSKAEVTYDQVNGCSDSKEPENDKVPEKTLHVIEVDSSSQKSPGSINKGSDNIQEELALSPTSLDSLCQSKSAFSSQDAAETNSESQYTESEADESVSYCDDDAMDMAEGEGQNRGAPRKGRELNHEVNESALLKLKFRRGKVLDLQEDVKSPRRLRFRRRSASGTDQVVNNERRRSFKRRDANGNIDDTKPVGMKVELRHQDVQEKKSEQGLFNRVIEETANKLVETRKSKVMALVGAFETVISLQEAKPSADKPSPHSSPAR